jgi:ribosome-binding factor A
MSERTARIDAQLREELMQLLQREAADPRIGFATVTRVETSRDLAHARVWVSVLGTEEERGQTMAALEVAGPWLRRRLAERLKLRRMPALTIRHDDSIAAADRVLRIFGEIERERDR